LRWMRFVGFLTKALRLRSSFRSPVAWTWRLKRCWSASLDSSPLRCAWIAMGRGNVSENWPRRKGICYRRPVIDLDEALTAAKEAAVLAGERILVAKNEELRFETKIDPFDRVTHVDKECQELILGHLLARFPGTGVLDEEDTPLARSAPKSPWRLVIDPIAGTENFLHRLPIVGVSIALEHEGMSKVGVMHLPILGDTYEAVEGRGARKNGESIKVSGCAKLRMHC